MLKQIKEILRVDEFIATSAVFPNIDREGIARELDLEAKGKERGQENAPSSDTKVLDQVEMLAISRIEELRRRGLEQYETHRRAYSERLGRATSARMAVEQETQDAISGFLQTVKGYQDRLVQVQEAVQDAHAYRDKFRQDHRLGTRPAREKTGWLVIAALGLVMVLIESLLNGYLFSQSNPLGLAGGALAAFLVSIVNVTFSTVAGIAGRIINSRRLLPRLTGLVICVAWIAAAGGYNLAVAHFRDAAESIGDWRIASETAIDTLKGTPLDLENIESWLLLLVGALISLLSFAKGFRAADPYPGYSDVSETLEIARERYVAEKREAIEELQHLRDEKINDLRDTGDLVQKTINDSVDALFGQSHLASAAGIFLEQSDVAANYCLSIYREANKSARTTPPPPTFNEPYIFRAVDLTPAEEGRRKSAEKEIEEINEMISRSAQLIFENFAKALDAHKTLDGPA